MDPEPLVRHIGLMGSTILHEHISISKCFDHSWQNVILQDCQIGLHLLFNEHQRKVSTIRWHSCLNHHSSKLQLEKHLLDDHGENPVIFHEHFFIWPDEDTITIALNLLHYFVALLRKQLKFGYVIGILMIYNLSLRVPPITRLFEIMKLLAICSAVDFTTLTFEQHPPTVSSSQIIFDQVSLCCQLNHSHCSSTWYTVLGSTPTPEATSLMLCPAFFRTIISLCKLVSVLK